MSTTQAPSSNAPPGPNGLPRRNLKKNQCDAAQPHCTNCIKAWQLALEMPGSAAAGSSTDGPSCDYDPVEGLVFTPETIVDPLVRAKAIQEQIAQLSGKLRDAQGELRTAKRPSSSRPSSSKKRRHTLMEPEAVDPAPPAQRPRSSTTLPQDPDFFLNATQDFPPPTITLHPPPGGPSPRPLPSRSPSFHASSTSQYPNIPEMPPLEIVNHLVDTFISNDPHAARIFHISTLKASVPIRYASTGNPTSKALLHAICAAASRYYVPSEAPLAASRRNSPSENTSETFASSDPRPRPSSASPSSSPGTSAQQKQQSQSQPPQKQSTGTPALPEGFAAFHAARAKTLITAALAAHQDSLFFEQDCGPLNKLPNPGSASSSSSGSPDPEQGFDPKTIRAIRDETLFKDMIQPMIVLTNYYYHEARGIEVWSDIGILTRALMSLGLNRPPQTTDPGASREILVGEEERKRAFWSTFILDRLLSAGGWSHCMAEEDTVANFNGCDPPLSAKAFKELGTITIEDDSGTPPPVETDSYALLVDSAVLLGRVNEFSARVRLRRRSLAAFRPVTATSSTRNAPLSTIISEDPMIRWEFNQLGAALNGGVGYWASNGVSGRCRQKGSMPRQFQHPIGITDAVDDTDTPESQNQSGLRLQNPSARLDTDLFLAHMIHHATILLLNFPVASFRSPNNSSSPSPSLLPVTIQSNASTDVGTFPDFHFSGPTATATTGQATLLNVYSSLPKSSDSTTIISDPFIRNNATTTTVVEDSCVVNSRTKCLTASRSIVDALSLIRATSFDISKLHPFVTTCWYIAGVVLLYEHQRCVDSGDVVNKASTAREVQILRLALLKYGMRSPIGARHERQLTIISEQLAAAAISGSGGSAGAGSVAEAAALADLRFDPLAAQPSAQSSSTAPTPLTSMIRYPTIPVFPFDTASLEQYQREGEGQEANTGVAPSATNHTPEIGNAHINLNIGVGQSTGAPLLSGQIST
ncbi:hypothetical protein FRB99_001800 [Tulasnella sp. 403]|nr:hypothetical protein FRB99_001800 [Tulasnella sp. 403]